MRSRISEVNLRPIEMGAPSPVVQPQTRGLPRRTASRCWSYYRQLALLCSSCCIFERGMDILAFQVEVGGQQLVDAGASGRLTEYCADGYAGIADAGQVAHPVWIDGDSLLAIGKGTSPSASTSAMGSTQGGISRNRRQSPRIWAIPGTNAHSAWNNGDTWGWFHLVSAARAGPNPATCRAFSKKRLMGFEPTTFCMASRRSSQLSYSRARAGF